MKRRLEELRSLPPAVKGQISFWSAFAVAGIVGLVWVTTLGARFDGGVVATETGNTIEEAGGKESMRSLNDLVEGVKTQAAGVTQALNSIEETTEEPKEAVSKNQEPTLFTPPQSVKKEEGIKMILIATSSSEKID